MQARPVLAVCTGRALRALRACLTFDALHTLNALFSLRADRALRAGVALRALCAGVALFTGCTGRALRALWALRACLTLDALHTPDALFSLRADRALRAGVALRALCAGVAFFTGCTGRAANALNALRACLALRAGRALFALDALDALNALRAADAPGRRHAYGQLLDAPGYNALVAHAGHEYLASVALVTLRAGVTLVALRAGVTLDAVHDGVYAVVCHLAVGELHPAALRQLHPVLVVDQVAGRAGGLPRAAVRAHLQHLVAVQADVLKAARAVRHQHRLLHPRRLQLRQKYIVQIFLDGLARLVKLGLQLIRRQPANVVWLIVQFGDDLQILSEFLQRHVFTPPFSALRRFRLFSVAARRTPRRRAPAAPLRQLRLPLAVPCPRRRQTLQCRAPPPG